MRALYNEFDPAAAHILRHIEAKGIIASGKIDERSIKNLEPKDVECFTQCHFFAGGGFWSIAARAAGWPDDRPLWTASCPCQPFSAAGQGGGTDGPRHLWPDLFRLVRACRPSVVVGEQVAGKAGYGWFDGVSSDLEGEGYACRAVDFPACSINAPHQRNRLYWVAVADSHSERLQIRPQQIGGSEHLRNERAAAFQNHAGMCVDSRQRLYRYAEPSIRFLVDGVPGRVDLWRVGGNAIVPQAATEVIAALLDTLPSNPTLPTSEDTPTPRLKGGTG